MTHSHDWIDVTRSGEEKRHLACNCGARARQAAGPAAPVEVYEEDSHHVWTWDGTQRGLGWSLTELVDKP